MKKGQKAPVGRMCKGSDHPRSKLEECQIPDIRAFLGAGRSQQWIANRYFVARCAIQKIANGTGWKHVQ
jgi:hypothetical protein